MSPISIRTLCLVTLILRNIHTSLEREIPRRSFLSRRAIDGTRGRKYFDPEEEGAFDSYGSAGGQYDPYEERTDFSDIRRNVPGEPGADYPAYVTLPQTGFTCEGRSRGYYADQTAGCQVFHVCHDVLVSSFLCPMGSIFSQKLLTCDWWTKVDCSSSDKYIDANRNSYQEDDDEMIRNAYAMIGSSLRSGADASKDGLVDPDSIGSVMEHRHRGVDRVTMAHYASMFAPGSDPRSNSEDYPSSYGHDPFPAYRFDARNSKESSESYREGFYPREKARYPYEHSPISVQQVEDRSYIGHKRNKYFQNSRLVPNGINTDAFQPSYAPTVPTVTTTTRKFYSPTVPTTFRPSTLSYKFDQLIDSSNYFFSRGETNSFATPPSVFPGNDRRTSETTRTNNRGDREQQAIYELEYDYANVNSADQPSTNRTNARENVEDIELRDSIGLGHALRYSFRDISIQEQNPIKDKGKRQEIESTTVSSSPVPLQRNSSNPSEEEIHADYPHTLARPEPTASFRENERNVETTEQYRTNREDDNLDEVVATTISPSSEKDSREITTGLKENLSESSVDFSTTSSTGLDKNIAKFELLNENYTNDKIDKVDVKGSGNTEFSKSSDLTRKKFQIKVPDLPDSSNRYSTRATGFYAGSRSTEFPVFQTEYSTDRVDHDRSTSYHGNVKETYNNDNEESSRSSERHSTREMKPQISLTDSWFLPSPSPFVPPLSSSSSSSSNQLVSKIPRRDVVSSTISYTDSSYDFDTSHESSYPFVFANKTEDSVTNNSSDLLFAEKEAIARGSNWKSACLDQSGDCSTSYVSSSTTLPLSDFGESTKTITITPSYSNFSEDTKIDSAFGRATTPRAIEKARTPSITSSIAKEVDVKFSKADEHSTKQEEKIDSIEALIKSIKPETLEQIEETIDKNDSPYLVTLTVNQDEKLTSTGEGSIDKLIARSGEKSSKFNEKLHELEIVKSFEPEIDVPIDSQDAASTLNVSAATSNYTAMVESRDSRNQENVNAINLLRLMSELFKLDRAPRPFSLPGARDQPARKEIVATVKNTGVKLEQVRQPVRKEIEELPSTAPSQSTEFESKVPLALSKEQLLDQLAKNFGEPLHRMDQGLPTRFSDRDSAPDFRTGPFTKSSNNYQRSSSVEATLPTIAVEVSKEDYRETTTTTTTTVAPKIASSTESAKTVVKTELLPSIGFSFDTNEGREEYVEAVLGGLIEPQPASSEKKETILLIANQTSSGNDTSRKIRNENDQSEFIR